MLSETEVSKASVSVFCIKSKKRILKPIAICGYVSFENSLLQLHFTMPRKNKLKIGTTLPRRQLSTAKAARSAGVSLW